MLGLNGIFYSLKASLDSQHVAEILKPPKFPEELNGCGLRIGNIRTHIRDLNIFTGHNDDDTSTIEAFLADFKVQTSARLRAAKLTD
jgi:hypothetical protein